MLFIHIRRQSKWNVAGHFGNSSTKLRYKDFKSIYVIKLQKGTEKHKLSSARDKNKSTHQNDWPHKQDTWLQPPFFSTALRHFGQGLVLAVIQTTVSDSSWHFLDQSSHMRQEQGEWASDKQLKQNCMPHGHSTSQSSSSSIRIAFPQWGTLGHHLTLLLSSIYDSKRKRSNFSERLGSLVLTNCLIFSSSQTALHLRAMHLMRLLWPSFIFTMKCSVQPRQRQIRKISTYSFSRHQDKELIRWKLTVPLLLQNNNKNINSTEWEFA